jgi:hypothetical protein
MPKIFIYFFDNKWQQASSFEHKLGELLNAEIITSRARAYTTDNINKNNIVLLVYTKNIARDIFSTFRREDRRQIFDALDTNRQLIILVKVKRAMLSRTPSAISTIFHFDDFYTSIDKLADYITKATQDIHSVHVRHQITKKHKSPSNDLDSWLSKPSWGGISAIGTIINIQIGIMAIIVAIIIGIIVINRSGAASTDSRMVQTAILVTQTPFPARTLPPVEIPSRLEFYRAQSSIELTFLRNWNSLTVIVPSNQSVSLQGLRFVIKDAQGNIFDRKLQDDFEKFILTNISTPTCLQIVGDNLSYSLPSACVGKKNILRQGAYDSWFDMFANVEQTLLIFNNNTLMGNCATGESQCFVKYEMFLPATPKSSN